MLYDITIAGVSAAAPSDGFIDYKTVYVYGNEDAEDVPATYAASLAKARANHRHKSVVMSIQFYSGMQIVNVTLGGTPDSNTAPTSIVYQVDCDLASVTTPDESSPGDTLTGEDAVKRIVARALVKAETKAMEVLDPTTATAPGNTTLYARSGPRTNVETVGALYATLTLAEAGVTVVASA